MKQIGVLICLISLLFLIPLFYNNIESGWDQYENTYIFYFSASVVLLVTMFYFLSSRAESNLSFSRADICLFLFACYAFFLVLARQYTSFLDEKVLTSLYLLLLYPVFKIIFASGNRIKIFHFVLLFIGLIASLHGLAQFVRFLPSPNPAFLVTGSFNNPGPYSGYLAAMLPFVIINFKSENKLIRTLSIATICCITVTLIITQSRAAWIALTVSSVFLLAEQFDKLKKIKASLILPVLCFILMIIPMSLLKSDSISGRKLIWQVSYNMFKDSPLTGLGPGQFAVQYNNYQANYFKDHSDDDLYSDLADNTYFAFSEPIQISVEYGSIGFGLFLIIIFFAFKDTKYDTSDHFTSASRAAIISICIFGLFSYPFSSIAISLIFVVCLAYLSASSQNHRSIDFNPIGYKVALVIVIVFVIAISYKVFERYNAFKQWKEAYTALNEDELPEALDDYKRLYPLLKTHGGFLFNYGAELSEAGLYEESVGILEKARLKFNHVDLYIFLGNNYKALKQFDKAEAAYLHASYMIPNRFFTKYLLVKVYVEQNKMNEALSLAMLIMEMKPKINSPTVASIKQEMQALLLNKQNRQSL